VGWEDLVEGGPYEKDLYDVFDHKFSMSQQEENENITVRKVCSSNCG
jgi:hypothetical protein